MREILEEINFMLESRIDKAYEAWYARKKETMFRAVDEVVGDGMLEVQVPDMSRETINDDEPKTENEVEAHKECAEIRKAAWKEIQQLIEMSVGVC
jgi:type 1 glutamine amidotransferase